MNMLSVKINYFIDTFCFFDLLHWLFSSNGFYIMSIASDKTVKENIKIFDVHVTSTFMIYLFKSLSYEI